jgi:hypothetical protein
MQLRLDKTCIFVFLLSVFVATIGFIYASSPQQTPAPNMASAVRRAAPIVFPATGRHTATVIFIHGLGDSGAGWADAVEYMKTKKQRLDEVKFVLPNAPPIPITMVSSITSCN